MRVYLAGPMTGVPLFNFPLFNRVAGILRDRGYEVFNPAQRDVERHNGVDISLGNERGDPEQAAREYNFSKRDALADDTWWICKKAEAICLLPGWEHSEGAVMEHKLAGCLRLKFMYWSETNGLG